MPIIPDREKAPILVEELQRRSDRCLLLRRPDGDDHAYVRAIGEKFRARFVRDGTATAGRSISEDELRRLILAWEPRGIRPVAGTPLGDEFE